MRYEYKQANISVRRRTEAGRGEKWSATATDLKLIIHIKSVYSPHHKLSSPHNSYIMHEKIYFDPEWAPSNAPLKHIS